MKSHCINLRTLAAVVSVAALLSGCASKTSRPEGADQLRQTLTQLQSDPKLAGRAAVAIQEAEAAVILAEAAQEDPELGKHLVIMADRKLKIAQARAQSRWFEDQRVGLSQQRERSRLDSRTQEADSARQELSDSKLQTADLQRQIVELNARPTDRGLIMTLGDVQFSTGKSQLREGVSQHLERLSTFLKSHLDRNVIIEGHADSQGSDQLNATLSKQRAEAVRSYLVSQGVDPARINADGKGASMPVASNDSPSGRQQNRRVEIVVLDPVSTSR
jgi:outer membrane protein OmpA-like peptidoglycan-associated protein